tara:strand:- start:204 stop:722 length:519 start_codon:yes stop_codon:yes gene_type:complete
MQENRQPFDAPIPGQSLTAEVGSRPWQSPPKYATVEDALTYYIPRITSDEMYDEFLDILELGVPITSLADTIQSAGVMQGLHSVDVGVLISPVIMEMLAYIGDEAGIEYELGMQKRLDEDKISDSKIALAMKEMRSKLPVAVAEANNKEDMEVDMVEEPVEPEPTGLMARRA